MYSFCPATDACTISNSMQPSASVTAVQSFSLSSEDDKTPAGLSFPGNTQIHCSDCCSGQYRRRAIDVPEETLEVIGENVPEDNVSETSDGSIPVRVLTNLVIYHRRTRKLVPLAKLQESLSEYEVAGDVCPLSVVEEEDDGIDEELESSTPDDIQRVLLDEILDFNFHHLDESGLDRSVIPRYITLNTTDATLHVVIYMSRPILHGTYWSLLLKCTGLSSCRSGHNAASSISLLRHVLPTRPLLYPTSSHLLR